MIGALGQDRRTLRGRRSSPAPVRELQATADRPQRSGAPLTPPAWIAALPSDHGPWRAWCVGGATVLTALAGALTLALGPISAASILYLPALLLVATASRRRWPAYGSVLLVVLLTDLAYRHAPAALQVALPPATTWPWYLGTRALSYSVLVLLTQALLHAVGTVRAYVSALEDAHAQAWVLALTDPLTGLANRRRFDQHLETTIAHSRRAGTAVALLLVDIDHFKGINDRWGHAAGDAALVQVAQALDACSGPGSLVARLGGDEFAVVLPAHDEGQARGVAQRIRDQLAAPGVCGARWAPLQVSIGAASLDPRPAAPSEDRDTAAALSLLATADQALYQMKASARRPA